jgi:glycosyltransferase involved in cell wall biosynthesis
MKDILFVIPDLSAGGAQKSLVNLLSQIDFTKFNVDLFLFNKNGIFINSIPKEVRVLELPNNLNKFNSNLNSSVKSFIKSGQVKLAYSRVMFTIKNRLIRDKAISEQYAWKYKSRVMDTPKKKYDVAIGYLEKSSIYFIVDKVKAKKKIGFIHNDYDKLGMKPEFDDKYFEQLDNIVTVSEECGKVLRERFPRHKKKVEVIYNIISPSLINAMSEQRIDMNYSGVKIVSVGRLCYQKGFDMALKACKALVKDGYEVRWYIIGEGEERERLEKMIEYNNLEDKFSLLGIRENPYPYIRKADIYVQSSRFEGKAIAIDEAKILHKPIIATNFSTVRDQIIDEVNGLVVDMNAKSLYEGIKRLINDLRLKEKLVENISIESLGTEQEIFKLYELL